MGKNGISSNVYGVWILFSIVGTFLSVLLDGLLRKVMGLDFISKVEVFSAVWFVVLGLALIRLEVVIKHNK